MLFDDEIVASLDSLTVEMNLLNHPFYREWTAGRLPLQRLRNYGCALPRRSAARAEGCVVNA